MARDFARKFYSSVSWRQVREGYMRTQDFICEICGAPADEVHHMIHLNPSNINDPEITLSFDNLQALCRQCHIDQHYTGAVREDVRFDEFGNLIRINPLINTDDPT